MKANWLKTPPALSGSAHLKPSLSSQSLDIWLVGLALVVTGLETDLNVGVDAELALRRDPSLSEKRNRHPLVPPPFHFLGCLSCFCCLFIYYASFFHSKKAIQSNFAFFPPFYCLLYK